MLVVVNKLFIFRYKRIWFPTEVPKFNVLDFVFLRQCSETVMSQLNPKEWIKHDFSTLHNNLLDDEGVLFSKIAKNTKYKINRATKEGVQTQTATINEFLPFFNVFAPTKSLKKLTFSNLKAYGDALIITKAYQNEAVLAMHAYVIDKNVEKSRVRLLYSATVDRTTTDIDLNLVGRANRLLHWKDMLTFKQMGVAIYDWGGIAGDVNNPITAGIDAFKMAYGGATIHEPHYEHKRLVLLKKMLGR